MIAPPNPSHFRSLLALTCLLFGFNASQKVGEAKDLTTPSIGYLRFDCPEASDTHLSVPFQRPARWSGKLGAAPADQGGGTIRLTLAGTPAFSNGELTLTPHLVFCRDGSESAGRYFTIIDHSASMIDITALPGELPGLGDEGLIAVIPAWTLATLFPHASQTTFHLSTGPLAPQRGSELLFFSSTSAGIDLAPSRRFFVTSTGWFEAGDYASADNVVILPGQAFAVRHREGATPTTFVPFDEVSPEEISLALPVVNGSRQDAMVAPPRPTLITLDQLDLAGTVFEESATIAAVDRKDELHVFDSSVPAINREASAIYFRSAGQWRRETTGFPAAGGTVIEPSSGLRIRKAAGTTASVPRWRNAPVYGLTLP